MKQDLLQATPPAGVVGLNIAGIQLNDFVLILTAVYTLFLIVDKGYTVWQKYKERKHGEGN